MGGFGSQLASCHSVSAYDRRGQTRAKHRPHRRTGQLQNGLGMSQTPQIGVRDGMLAYGELSVASLFLHIPSGTPRRFPFGAGPLSLAAAGREIKTEVGLNLVYVQL